MSDAQAVAPFAIVEQPLRTWERLYESEAVRKTVLLVLLALIWEGYARALNNPDIFPRLSDTIVAFWEKSSRESCRAPPRTRSRCCSKGMRLA